MLGGLLQHHDPDLDVLLIGRGKHGEALQHRGEAILDGPWGTHRVPIRASSDVADIQGSDFVLLTVKSQATTEAACMARPFLGDSVVISIQNGINEARLSPHLNPARLVMGVTATNMAVREPGRVSLQLGGASLLGPSPDGKNRDAVGGACQLLQKTGLPVQIHADINGVRYNKLAINAVGYASCLSASNFISEALADGRWRHHVGRVILTECLDVFEAAGIQPRRISGTPGLRSLRSGLRCFDLPIAGSALEAVVRRRYDKKPILFSLYQDLKQGKKTEVDFVNGEIVRLAESVGREAPGNELVVQMVHELEAQTSAGFFERQEVIHRFKNSVRS